MGAAAVAAGLVLVLGSWGMQRQLEGRPELVNGDPNFMKLLKLLRKIGWGILAFCALAVVAGLHRLPGYGSREGASED